MSELIGRGARSKTIMPLAGLRRDLRTLESALANAHAVGYRSDGWSVGEVLAHAADLAEVFCERIRPGTFPAAVTTAVRDTEGHVDIARTNEALRYIHGSDPIQASLARIDRCLVAATPWDPGVSAFWLRRLDAHTREHLSEVWAVLGSK